MCVIATIAVCAWWSFDDDAVASYRIGEVKLIASTEDYRIYRIDREITQHRACPGVTHRILVDGVMLDMGPELITPGVADVLSHIGRPVIVPVTIKVPRWIQTDVRFVSVIEWHCNPWQRYVAPLRETPGAALLSYRAEIG